MSSETPRAPQLTVEQIQKSLQVFGTWDYVVFVGMLLGCAAIGVFYALRGRAIKSEDAAVEYLMGGRKMNVFPIGMSLVASFISGITLLGLPTETYVNGTEYLFIFMGILLTGVLAGTLFLPILHDMKLSSTYEYLERRFDKKVRLFGSLLFALAQVCWLPIVIYVPALAFNHVTGINLHVVTPCVCLVCIFYTTVGGLKAVVWTDVVQTWLMVGAILVVAVKGTLDIGGVGVVWDRCLESGRLEVPRFDLDLTKRHTFFSLTVGVVFYWLQQGIINQNMIQRFMATPTIQQATRFDADLTKRHTFLSLTLGACSYWLQHGVVNQNMVQRYMAMPTKKKAIRALWIFIAGTIGFTFLCGYCGLLVYATYHDCDPLTTKLAKAKDQVLPTLVMRVMADYPGMPGLFVSGVFSAALSSLSTGLNSMSAVVLEDFIKPYATNKMSERATNIVMRGVVVFFGVVCVSLVYVVERLGSVLQLSMSLGAMTSGPSFGIFCAGIFVPWINAKGAFYGGMLGLASSAFVIVGSQRAQAAGMLRFPPKPTSVEGCDYLYNTTASAVTAAVTEQYVFPLFKLSYLWYTLFGGLVTLVLAFLISAATGFNDLEKIDVVTLSPLVRQVLPRRKSILLKKEEEELILMLKKNKNKIDRNLDME